MADAVASVGAIRAGDTITYIDHFGGDSEGPASTLRGLCTEVGDFLLDIYTEQPTLAHSVHATECADGKISLKNINCKSPGIVQAQRGRRPPVRLQR